MAKRAKRGEALDAGAFDAKKGADFVRRVESVQRDIDTIMQAATDECSPQRKDIEAIKKEADTAGIPRAELNAIIRKRKLERGAEACRAKLSEEQQGKFDQLDLALDELESSQAKAGAEGRAERQAAASVPQVH